MQKKIFRLSAKRISPFKSAGASVQSTTGSRGVCISGSNAGYTMFRGSVKSTGYPLHSSVPPSLHLACVIVCHHISTGLYNVPRLFEKAEFCLSGCPNHVHNAASWPTYGGTFMQNTWQELCAAQHRIPTLWAYHALWVEAGGQSPELRHTLVHQP